MAVTLELGLGGRARYHLITANNIVSCWPLSEIYQTTARDIAYDKNPGTYVDVGGCSRGVSIPLPEGALGFTFDGTGYVLVPNDPGYLLPEDGVARTLSLANGPFAVAFWLKTTTNDATLRCIVGKTETNSSGNGWYVALQSGAIVFSLTVGGVSVFNFSRGSVADGVGRWIVCSYDEFNNVAGIYIAGSLSGLTVAATTTPTLTTGDLRIGSFNDGAGKFIGTLAYVSISRNELGGLPALLQNTLAWTDVTSDLRDEPAEIVDGTTGVTLRDRQAGIGTFDFTLNNTPKVAGVTTLGRYTIGHANCRTGFDLGIPVRFTDGSLIRFRGWLAQADPEANTRGGRRTFCQAVDWFSVAARTPTTAVPILTDVRSDQAYAALIDEADQPPVAVSLGAGSSQFPFCFDRVAGNLLSELAAVVASEGGQAYSAPDAVTGGVVTFEGRGVRQLDTTPDATFDQTMAEMDVRVRSDAMINIANPTFTPREAGALDTDVLYIQERRQLVTGGVTLTVEGNYQDPGQSQLAIGGTDFQAFTAGTDYTFTANENGTGLNLIASLSESHVFGGSGFRIDFNSPVSGWVAWQIRGRMLLTDRPVTPPVQARDSVRLHGPHPYDEQFAYLDDTTTAIGFGQLAVNLFANTPRVPEAVVFRPKPGSSLDTTVRARKIGDLVALGDPQSAVVTTTRYWIQNERLVYRVAGARGGQTRVEATFGVFPSMAEFDTPFGVWDGSYWDASFWGF